jgi:TolB-like protein/Tfp pilus assembly protein PilF
MFTDMVGYSALSQRTEALALDLLNEHREILRGAFARYGGREIEAVGDGFFVEFSSAVDAARCAIEIQRNLHDRNSSAPPERRIHVRIGAHLGDIVAQEARVHGDGVNIAARIEPLAEAGGICLSEDIVRQIQNKIELPLRRLGKADLKNIRMPVAVYRLVLPWERRHLPGVERLAFSVRQRQMRRTLIGAGSLLISGAVAGAWIWKRTQSSAALFNNRIAVLPFVSLSASSDDEYFVDGMTEEMISRLSRVSGLEVIARTSIAPYKGTKKTIGQIARELNVGTVLEGSVRTAAGKARITAQLINATNDAHLWSEDYDRELDDIFAVQADIARRVVDALAARLALPDGRPTKASGTPRLDAYNAYLRGRFQANKASAEGLESAIGYYEQAIRLDSSYALAYASLAEAYEQMPAVAGVATALVYPKAKAAAEEALRLDESLPEAHTALAVARAFFDWDWVGAEKSFSRALELSSSSASAHQWYAWYLLFLGRVDEGITEMRRAAALDPVSISVAADVGWALQFARRWDESISVLKDALALDAEGLWTLGALVWAHLGAGRYKEALGIAEREIQLIGREIYVLCDLACSHVLLGNIAEGKAVLDEMSQKAMAAPGEAWFFGLVYWCLAEREARYRDDLFKALDQSREERSWYLVMTSNPWWDKYRSDSDWVAFRRQLGLPP